MLLLSLAYITLQWPRLRCLLHQHQVCDACLVPCRIQSHWHQHQCSGAFNTCCDMVVVRTCQCDVSTPMLLHERALSLNCTHTSRHRVYVHQHHQCGALRADIYITVDDVCAACVPHSGIHTHLHSLLLLCCLSLPSPHAKTSRMCNSLVSTRL